MPQSPPSVTLREWERIDAPAHAPLQGLTLDDPAMGEVARMLRQRNLLHVTEGRYGLSLQARQHVGMVRLGPLQITVQPKLPPGDLWHILAYGLGLETLKRSAPVEVQVPEAGFVDLLAMVLLSEAESLWRRGLRRSYRPREEWLASPRGRIDLRRLSAALPLTQAALPCLHYERSMDTLENRVVRAGLGMASRMVQVPAVKAALIQAERRWAEVCGSMAVDSVSLRQAERARNRLTSAYAPAHRLIAVLYEGLGMPDDLEELAPGAERPTERLPGFLWDMAALFERFVARFLAEHLRGAEVRTQESIRHLYRVVRSPRPMRAPRPRPDLLLVEEGRTVAVLDTKYRAFDVEGLTRDILYQMSVYAVAYASAHGVGEPVPAIVLYPGQGVPREDITYGFRHGLRGSGGPIGESPIILRAIDWVAASRTLREPSRQSELSLIAREWVGRE